MRIRIDFAYDGTDFSGWAAQPARRTVEDALSPALTTVLRSPQPVRLTVAGRTDAGVHARGAVCHADVDRAAWDRLPGRSGRRPEAAAVTRLNGVLPADVVVRAARPAPPGFDARFSATSRRYTYRLCDRPDRADPTRRRDTVTVRHPLDVTAMHAAAQRLLGLQDFAAFCKKREGATTIRTLLDYSWRREPDGTCVGTVVADAFCHSMVRSLVGAVLPVGEGRRPVDWPAEVLAAARRDPAVVVMPPQGLCLEEVTYPPDADLEQRAEEARAIRTLPQ
ncbi:MAG TPA: tRNA pseudouridine(38-40) synthase TruA [Segeticoccus sp.]|uniref:tRNA pseudouridine(38-40) synthase TruA n=1 Tax=Segeticoccus sp. TaxID=2706531 RepID=UPI002D7ED9AB|nr:tRNA pseudouridine(38-40) synthase TruA [Segeticoccus sp.]HET8599237.1 tRNA pseudouridine(38-40) synthase TruA [Segeticoccus sp.]